MSVLVQKFWGLTRMSKAFRLGVMALGCMLRPGNVECII